MRIFTSTALDVDESAGCDQCHEIDMALDLINERAANSGMPYRAKSGNGWEMLVEPQSFGAIVVTALTVARALVAAGRLLQRMIAAYEGSARQKGCRRCGGHGRVTSFTIWNPYICPDCGGMAPMKEDSDGPK